MKHIRIAAICSLLYPTIALGAPVSPAASATKISSTTAVSASCEGKSNLIKSIMMEAAFIDAESVGDNSLPRASFREAKKQTKMLQAIANLDVMRAAGCPIYAGTLNPEGYLGSAFGCMQAIGAQAKDEYNSAETKRVPNEELKLQQSKSCDRTHWLATD